MGLLKVNIEIKLLFFYCRSICLVRKW